MLRQHCPDPAALEPINQIELALHASLRRADADQFAGTRRCAGADEKLVEATGLSEDRARWAIETWVGALCREKPETSGITRDWSQWNRLDVGPITAHRWGPIGNRSFIC